MSNPPERPPPDTQIGRLQRKMWLMLDDPSSSQVAKYLQSGMMCVIMLSIVTFTMASNPSELIWIDVWVNASTGEVIPGSVDATAEISGAYLSDSPRRVNTLLNDARYPYYEIETFCIAVFTCDYFLRLLASPQGPGVVPYLVGVWNIIDLISILPFYLELILAAAGLADGSSIGVLSILRLIRLTRITRIFKMSKNFQSIIMLGRSLRKSLSALVMLFSFMTITGILFATLIFSAEGGQYDQYRRQWVRRDGSASPFESIPTSLWWTIVTMTTVGYGDQVPVSPIGKLIAVLTMFCGLIVLSLPITIIGTNFDDEYRELRKRAQDEKERARKKERALLRQQIAQRLTEQQERLTLEAETIGSPGAASPVASSATTPAAAAAVVSSVPTDAPVATMVTAAASLGAPLPAPLWNGMDPTKLVQTMIHEAHYSLNKDIETLMIDHERLLRKQIKTVLRSHANHCEGLSSGRESSQREA